MTELRPSKATALLRGLCKRCPRCGGGDLFVGWFRMRPRCPTCNCRFERAEAFFLGSYMLNLGVTEGLVFVLTIVPCIVLLSRNPDADLTLVVVAGLVAAVVAPLAFYPYSKALWSAIDLVMGSSGVPDPAEPEPD